MKTKDKQPRKAPKNKMQKHLDDLIAKQGVAHTATLEHLLGAGSGLWENESDFQQFLKEIKSARRQKE
jgi:hypothetical protein